MHRRQTQNLTPLHISQLLSHNPIQSRPNRLSILINQHTRVVIESHDRSIFPLVLLPAAHDDCVSDVAASNFVGCGDRDGVGFGTEVSLLLDDYYYSVAWRGDVLAI
jgi:hypothetical protein